MHAVLFRQSLLMQLIMYLLRCVLYTGPHTTALAW
jgi:hypothetical protein